MAKRDSNNDDLLQNLRDRILPNNTGLDDILDPGKRPQGKGLGRILTLAAGALTVWEMMRERQPDEQQSQALEDEAEIPVRPTSVRRSRSEEIRQRARDLRKR